MFGREKRSKLGKAFDEAQWVDSFRVVFKLASGAEPVMYDVDGSTLIKLKVMLEKQKGMITIVFPDDSSFVFHAREIVSLSYSENTQWNEDGLS